MKRHSVTVICLFPVTSEARGAGVRFQRLLGKSSLAGWHLEVQSLAQDGSRKQRPGCWGWAA